METVSSTQVVGVFTLDGDALTGPADYFQSRGGIQEAVRKAFDSATYRFGAAGASPSPAVALLVALQTDYAAYQGELQMARWTA